MKVPHRPLSLKEVLESYNHITLTEDEITEAMINAKRKKEEAAMMQSIREREMQNRKQATTLLDVAMIKNFILRRAERLFRGRFVLDENNEDLFNLLCLYFTNNPGFAEAAAAAGVEHPAIEKGILVAGNFGTGKTWMMKLFQQNARQTFYLRSAKDIAQAYLVSEDKKIPAEYIELFKNPANDASVFYQPVSGLCIDDMGAENKKNNFGNIMNVVGDLLEERYAKKLTGVFLHATTNLSAGELKEFYGERVASRMREIFNFIELPGLDRRK